MANPSKADHCPAALAITKDVACGGMARILTPSAVTRYPVPAKSRQRGKQETENSA